MEDDYIKLARYSLENFVRTHKPAKLPENLPEEGAFVYSKSDDPMLYWSEVTNSAKIAVRDGDNLPQILTMLENAVGTVKAAMA